MKEVVADLSQRFQFGRVVFVGDRGMVTESNLKTLQARDDEWGFLVGMTRRQNPEAETLIDRVHEAAWLECPGGINTREKPEDRRPRTRVQEVRCDRAGVRVFVVDSDERRAYEQRMREKAMQRVRTGLEKIQTRVAKGRLKNPEKIGAAVERVLQRNHGYRYYDWQLRDGRLNIFEHPVNLPREKKYEGKYLIQTDQPRFTPEEAVAHSKELNEVEQGFHALKDPLGMRPIWHRVERGYAHTFSLRRWRFSWTGCWNERCETPAVGFPHGPPGQRWKPFATSASEFRAKLGRALPRAVHAPAQVLRSVEINRSPSSHSTLRRRNHDVVTNREIQPLRHKDLRRHLA